MLREVPLEDAPEDLQLVVKTFNLLLTVDGQALSCVMMHRCPCNDAMANLPELPVGRDDGKGEWGLTALGLFGQFFNYEQYRLTVDYDEETRLVRRFFVMQVVTDESEPLENQDDNRQV